MTRAMLCQVAPSLGRAADPTWKRQPSSPRQADIDNAIPVANLCWLRTPENDPVVQADLVLTTTMTLSHCTGTVQVPPRAN